MQITKKQTAEYYDASAFGEPIKWIPLPRFHLTMVSGNGKTGPIPVSTSANSTCPDACPLKSKGCYASAGGPLALHWRKVSEQGRGDDWATFVSRITALPSGQLWRHNQAGDLPGENNAINTDMLAQLVDANEGKRGWTYTHKPVTGDGNEATCNRAAIVRCSDLLCAWFWFWFWLFARAVVARAYSPPAVAGGETARVNRCGRIGRSRGQVSGA